MRTNGWLILAGCLSLIASLLHVACIVGGPAWYRFFGAGERMARMAERGDAWPTVVTLGIAAVLMVWAIYAFSGAGLIGRPPLLRAGLVAISAVYLVRGLVLVPALFPAQFPMLARLGVSSGPFWIWSSAIVLAFGLAYAIGTWTAWDALSRR
jgi:hypothetical protein